MDLERIFLLGFMGSGKSHWGKIWADVSGIPFIDLDTRIEKATGMLIADLFEKEGEDHFRKQEALQLRETGCTPKAIISTGGGTPCYYENMGWMNRNGVTLFLQASPAYILSKVMLEKEKRPLLKKLNDAELLFFIEKTLEDRMPYYMQAQYTISCENLTSNSLQDILPELKIRTNNE